MNRTQKNLTALFVIILLTALPYMFNNHFWTTYTLLMLSYVAQVAYPFYVFRGIKVKKWLTNTFKVVCVAIFLFQTITLHFYAEETTDYRGEDVTYVIYKEDCPYCQVAENDVVVSSNVFSRTHLKPVYMVNMSKKTEASERLIMQVNRVGFIKNGNSIFPYTMMKKDGTPHRPGHVKIYEILKEVNK